MADLEPSSVDPDKMSLTYGRQGTGGGVRTREGPGSRGSRLQELTGSASNKTMAVKGIHSQG